MASITSPTSSQSSISQHASSNTSASTSLTLSANNPHTISNIIQLNNAAITKQAEDYIKLHGALAGKCILLVTPTQPLMTIIDLFNLLLQSYPGFVLGECHLYTAPHRLLPGHFPYLKQIGTNSLFMEGLRFHHADKIRAFNSSSNSVNFFTSGQPHNNTLLAARNAGIHLYPIDYKTRGDALPDYSIVTLNLNYTACIAVQEAQKKLGLLAVGKYIIWVGAWHTNNTKFNNREIIGISEMLGIPSIVILDAIAYKRKPGSYEINCHYDASSQLRDLKTNILLFV